MRCLQALLADERCLCKADNSSAKIALVEERRHLADERHRHEAAAQAAALAEQVLEEERRRHEAAASIATSAEQALVEEHRRHDASARAATSAELALAEERRRHEMAVQTATTAKAGTQEMLAEADTERRHALPASVTEAIRRVQAACNFLAAPLDPSSPKLRLSCMTHLLQQQPR